MKELGIFGVEDGREAGSCLPFGVGLVKEVFGLGADVFCGVMGTKF